MNTLDVPQDQRRGSAVAKKKVRECSVKSLRCPICSFDKIRGAIALLLEPAKAVEQEHVFNVLQNQKRESAVLCSSKQGSFPKSEEGKFCSRCLFFDGCKHFDFCEISDRKTMFQMFLFFTSSQSPVIVIFFVLLRPTMNSPVRR